MTPAQLEANRANAQLSTGPVTEAGKQIVSQNALKHGLTGKTHAALPGEEQDFEEHCQGFRKSFAPAGILEENLVRSLAENYWRLRRAHAMENALFERVLLDAEAAPEPTGEPLIMSLAAAWSDAKKGLQRMSRYAAAIQRTIDKITAELKAAQDQRQAAYDKAREQAILLTHLAAAQQNAFDPAHHFGPPENHGGFVYSREEIRRAITHTDRLQQARMLMAAAAPQPQLYE